MLPPGLKKIYVFTVYTVALKHANYLLIMFVISVTSARKNVLLSCFQHKLCKLRFYVEYLKASVTPLFKNGE